MSGSEGLVAKNASRVEATIGGWKEWLPAGSVNGGHG